jgi:hypothetical protein
MADRSTAVRSRRRGRELGHALYDAALAELAAVGYAGPAVPEPRTDRSARQNLLAVFTAHCDVLAGKTPFPSLAIKARLIHEPEPRAIFADAVVAPRLRIVESILPA